MLTHKVKRINSIFFCSRPRAEGIIQKKGKKTMKAQIRMQSTT